MTEPIRTRILSSCYKFLLPVARFLLRGGISAREFEEVARLAFIHVAMHEFGLRGRETNSSRISAMTGIPRKEVAKLRNRTPTAFLDLRDYLSPLGEIIQRWSTDSSFCDSQGVPQRLELMGEGATFESLVRKFGGDIPIGAVRAELSRLGAIEIGDDGKLGLCQTNLIPKDFDEKLISAMTYSLRGLAETIAHNSGVARGSSELRLERYIESRPLTESEIEKLRPELHSRLDEITREIDQRLSVGDAVSDQPTRRIGVGVYYSE